MLDSEYRSIDGEGLLLLSLTYLFVDFPCFPFPGRESYDVVLSVRNMFMRTTQG